ncbi:cerebellar degeneration-related protein 2 isoform X2 [Nilaparvata lugens]|uniref:cerebellar degeneration-related protein 2 isoform X2 n=1 Tax=Nilaparvata lugens TaxID=108931 RepID=UPI00193DF2A6|nr:cerebellar degeneration-related protein 2 isoform X2 [Nilaparvata lugens]XP_039292895.1 cerebellar degeneration-related protein 2 isoform X2 [Nilaparvata lugens]
MSKPEGGLADSSESAPNSLECWDYSVELECLRGNEDLQLAAELGKTLLERNKELETSLRQHQNVIEDQTQEIEYLTKQTAALREVNDSRLRIYEQLEVSIQDLERANQRLAIESTSDKKLIKSLNGQVESLEVKCEDLQKQVDELTVSQEAMRRRQSRRSVCQTPDEPPPNHSQTFATAAAAFTPTATVDDEVTQLLQQLQEARTQRAREQRKVQELEEQMAAVLQDNSNLEEKLSQLQQKEEDMKSLQEELSMLEEIRQGHLCRRCLRGADERSIMAEEEDEELSVIDSLVDETQRNSVLMQLQESLGESCQGDNPYRVLVEKYEALLKVQRQPGVIIRPPQTVSSNNCLSLQEELQLSGDFSAFNKDDSADENEMTAAPRKPVKAVTINGGKAFSATPTDFSETETSSSGFSDETSNKGTQTDAHFPPGSFLCTISDGDDCRFSIYDDASPVESRFRKTPEYRQLFREIFAVLKRAAEAKDEGEKLPLLDDYITAVCEDAPKVPPVTPAKEEAPNLPDSEETSEAPSEDVTPEPETKQLIPTTTSLPETPVPEPEVAPVSGCTTPVPPKRQEVDISDYYSCGVKSKKKSSKKNVVKTTTTSSAEAFIGLNAKVSYSSKVTRRKRPTDSPSRQQPDRSTWCVSTGTIKDGGLPNSSADAEHHQQTFASSASHEVAKLKMLEKSYAEVLRLGRQKLNNRNSFHRK